MKKLSLLIVSVVFSGLIGRILVWQFWAKKLTPPEINLKTTKLAEIPKKYELDRYVFSPNGKKIAYRVEEGNKDFIVVNDKEGKRYDWVEDLVFSSDGKYLAYGARDGNEFWWIVEPVE